MAEGKSRYLSRVRTALWWGNSLAVSLLLIIIHAAPSVWWWLLAIVFACVLGYREVPNALRARWLYAAVWIGAFLSIGKAAEFFPAVLVAIFYGFLMFLLLGVIHIRFRDPEPFADLFYFLLSCAAFALYLFSGPGAYSFGSVLILLLFLYFTGKEYAAWKTESVHGRLRVYLGGIALLTAQTAWIVSSFSVGYLNGAALVLVFHMTALTVVIHYFRGMLQKTELLKDIGFFAFFSAIVLILSYYV